LDETSIRLAVFQWLRERERFNGGIFPGTVLNAGITLYGQKVTLKGATGIWFPAGFRIPLSISTSNKGPYDLDEIGNDGMLTYAYRGTDPNHRDNAGLREAHRTRTPLVYFKEVHAHRYQAIWPVMVLEDHPNALCVKAAIDPAYAELRTANDFESIEASPLDLRRYAWTQTRQRLHQSAFREVVLAAYDRHCAICRLNHPELLDAAHIIADSEDNGVPVVSNGLSLCKIHHAAYDLDIVGVTPDYTVHIREDILSEHDGPMLRHGLQELDGTKLILPRHEAERPDRSRLEERYRRFLSA